MHGGNAAKRRTGSQPSPLSRDAAMTARNTEVKLGLRMLAMLRQVHMHFDDVTNDVPGLIGELRERGVVLADAT